METIHGIVVELGGFVWGPWCLIPLLLGAGVYFMIGLKFMPLRALGHAFGHMWRGRKHAEGAEGELTPFKALMTSLAATVGTGNIVGVATAIYLGGPGAVFWMWMTALFGMATKYCEAMLAVKYRDVLPNGSYVGGPMYYIRKGLGEQWKWLAFLFAVFGSVACFGIGNMTQANAIGTNVLNMYKAFHGMPHTAEVAWFGINATYIMAGVLFVLASIVIIGGVKRIGDVAGILVPVMAGFYILMGIVIMIANADKVGFAFGEIFGGAFSAQAVGGGAVGSVMMGIQRGVSRGLFSNEAGLGSAPIAHATATTKDPVHQGFLGMLDPFIDTIIVCTITAVVILIADLWPTLPSGQMGALTSMSFDKALPGTYYGQMTVTVALALFAFSTILGWFVYGERCIMYLFGHQASLPFKIIFCLVIPFGTVAQINFVWDLADLFNGLMALPNLIALLLLSPVVFRATKEYFDKLEQEKKLKASGVR